MSEENDDVVLVEDDEKEMNALSLLFVDNDLLFKLPELVPPAVVEE